MASTAAEPTANGHHDHIVRPRPRKLVHSQLSAVSNASSNGGDVNGGPTTPLSDSGMNR